jgi:hemagglutinin family protein
MNQFTQSNKSKTLATMLVAAILSGSAFSAMAISHEYGVGNSITGDQSLAVGQNNLITGDNAVTIGYGNKALKSDSTVIGSFATADGVNASAVGSKATAIGTSALAVGSGSKASADSAVAIGNDSRAKQKSSVALGQSSKADGVFGTALGDSSKALADGSVAISVDSQAKGVNSMAMGRNSITTHDNSVALGSDSVSKLEKQVLTATVGTTTYNGFAGTNPIATVSVGDVGKERQIVNVAAGAISATSTDAINGSQLYAVATRIGQSVSGKASVVEAGNLITVTTSTNANGQTVYTVAGTDFQPAISANTANITKNTNAIQTNTANIAQNTKDIKANTDYIKAVEQKLPEVQAGDNVSVTSTTDANGKITYTVSGTDYQPAINKVEAKADANTKAIDENKTKIAENAKGVKDNADKINEVEKEAKRHTVIKSGKNTTVTQSLGANGEAVYTVNADVGNMAEVDEKINKVNQRIGAVEDQIGQNAKRIDKLDQDVRKNRKRADAGIASVAAMANIPQVFLPGKSGFGVGVGHKRGQSALAVGYSRASDSGKHLIKLSAGFDNQRDITVGAGYMYQW